MPDVEAVELGLEPLEVEGVDDVDPGEGEGELEEVDVELVDATAADSVEVAVDEVDDAERSIDWKSTPALSASRWSWTSKLACSPSAGTAFPSTTRRR